MIPLCTKFETRYFIYTQMKRKGPKALWKCESKLSDYVHYELVYITFFPGRQNRRKLPPTREYYPYYIGGFHLFEVCYTEADALEQFQQWVYEDVV